MPDNGRVSAGTAACQGQAADEDAKADDHSEQASEKAGEMIDRRPELFLQRHEVGHHCPACPCLAGWICDAL